MYVPSHSGNRFESRQNNSYNLEIADRKIKLESKGIK
jgi:hypothetical protein